MRAFKLRHRRVFAACTAVFISILAISIFFTAQKPIRAALGKRLAAATLSHALDENRWRELIGEDGGQQAYEEFAGAVSQLSALDQHTAVHLFGSALYEEEGLAGLAVCDQRFFGGCFHQFIGRALVGQGYAIVPQLVSVCASEPMPRRLFCAHGVGHGLVAAVGYHRTDLTKALVGCDSFSLKNRTSCYQGAFMEYEERTVLGPDAGIAPFKENWYEPCDSLSGSQLSVCLFHQSQWWWDILEQGGSDRGEIITKIGSLCAHAGSEASVEICFTGMGNTFGFRLPTDLAAKACISSSPDQRRVQSCVQSLARRESLGGDPSLKACSYLTDTERPECESQAVHTSVLMEDNLLQSI